VTGYNQGFRIVLIMLANIQLRRSDNEKMKAAGNTFKLLKPKKGVAEREAGETMQ
jgi:hypothetical protein